MGNFVGLRHLPRAWKRILFLLVFALALGMIFGARAMAQDLDKPCLVVATDGLAGPYHGTVMLATPIAGGHVGVILNRPTKVALADLFPDHAPSKAVTNPVYVGGPALSESMFAVVPSQGSPGIRSLSLMPGIWLVMDAASVDRVIETRPNEARYYVGLVIWRPGELAEEVRKGWMAIRPADASKLFLKDTVPLHDQLLPAKGRIRT